MRYRANIICLLFILVTFVSSMEAQDTYEVTQQANVEMTLNYLGNVGNSFRGNYNNASNSGSCEYPKGSKKEHIFFGGLWVGGLYNGNTIAVSTGAVNSSNGYATGAAGFEFTAPIGTVMKQKSKLLESNYYSQQAVSHQDLISDFTDKNILVPGSNQQIVGHVRPLNIDVHYEAYNWNFSSADFFVPLSFTITNSGTVPVDSVYVGYWIDMVVRDVAHYPPGGTSFYSSGGNGYLDTLYMGYEYDAENIFTITPNTKSYVGLKFLGAQDVTGKFLHPKLNTSFFCNYNTWFFSASDPIFFKPTNDLQYYLVMKNGINHAPDWPLNVPGNLQQKLYTKGNRSNVVSVGPFAKLSPGQSIKVDFAVVCASETDDGNMPYQNTTAQRQEFVNHANTTQTSYNGEDINFNGILDPGEDQNKDGKITRWVFPEPPEVPYTKMVAKDQEIELYWTDNSINSVDIVSRKKDFEGFRIYKTEVGFDVQENADIQKSLHLVAQYDIKGDGLFYDTGFDSVLLANPVTFEGDTHIYTHKYIIKNLANGWQTGVSITAFDTGDPTKNLPSYESSVLQNLKRVFPGAPANNSLKTKMPFAYPNPYYGLATWEGQSSLNEDRKITFSNLPGRCKVRIFTQAGDLVDEFDHNSQYSGSDLGRSPKVGWYNTYSNTKQTVFSGGEHSWDLLSTNSQTVARGLYLFSVEDLDSGNTFPGKFLIIK